MPDSPSTARELLDAALEFTKGWVGVQPGPRIFLPSCRTGIPGEKNDCERTRKQETAIPAKPASSPDTHDTTSIRRGITRRGQGRGLCPQTPEIYRFGPIPESKTETGHR